MTTASDLTDMAVAAWQDDPTPANLERVRQCMWRLICKIAGKFRSQSTATCSEEDLIHEGWMAVQRAAALWQRGEFRFSTYASRSARFAMIAAIRQTSLAVRLPVNTPNEDKRCTEEAKAERQALQDKARAPAHRTELFWDKWHAGPSPSAMIEDEEHRDGRARLVHRLLEDLAETRPVEAEVLRLRFGIDGREPVTHKEIVRQFAVGRHWSHEKCRLGLHKLRKLAEQHGLTGVEV